jgi:AcrR family transcriptional regulator
LNLSPQGIDVEDRRQQIIDAGLAILREEGLSGFTQPRIAARTGLRQSHITYYYPTRADLVAAVARAAIKIQASDAKAMATRFTTKKEAAEAIAAGTVHHENTRILMSLSQAASLGPEIRMLFNELTDDIVAELTALLKKLALESSQTNADILHALFIGLSIVNLATERKDGEARSKAVLDAAFDRLTPQEASLKR